MKIEIYRILSVLVVKQHKTIVVVYAYILICSIFTQEADKYKDSMSIGVSKI
jgi:hypothetical protein